MIETPENNLPVTSTAKLDRNSEALIQDILEESNVDKMKDLTNLFTANQVKKDTVRVHKLDQLLSEVQDLMANRIANTPDNFTNQELLAYLSTVQMAREKAQKNMKQAEELVQPLIQQNTQVNINMLDTMTRDQRAQVLDAVRAALKAQEGQTYSENEYTIINKESTEGDN